MNLNDLFTEEKVRLDPKCWTGKKIGNPKTKMKGGVRVNNCVPAESVEEGSEESYMIIRTDAEGKKDMFAKFSTYEKAQKELDGLLDHPLHTKYKQKFEIKRKGGEQSVAEGSDEIRTAGRGAIRIPGDMSAPHWREPTWSFQEIAQKLGIPVSALNLLAFNRIGGFPEALPGLAARYGSKKYYKQSEIKRWVNANNVREKLKQGMLEAGDESQGLKFTVPIIPNNMPGGANLPAGGAPKWTSTKIPGVSSHTGPAPKVTQSPNINTKIDAAANVPAYVRRGLPDPVTTPVNKPKITVRPGETQSQAMQRSQTEKEFGKFLQGQSGQTFGPAAGRGNTNPSAPNWKNDQTDIDLEEAGKQQKGADYRDPKEVDYDGEYDAMVARVKRLAGLGPMKTVYDPTKRQYRNMPTAVQPKK